MNKSVPLMMIFIFLYFIIASSTQLDLKQSSYIKWQNENISKNLRVQHNQKSHLFVYNFQSNLQASFQRIKKNDQNSIQVYNISQITHQVLINYYLFSTSQKIKGKLKGKRNDIHNQNQEAQQSILSVVPLPNHGPQQHQFNNFSFVRYLSKPSKIFPLPNQLYSEQPECGKFSPQNTNKEEQLAMQKQDDCFLKENDVTEISGSFLIRNDKMNGNFSIPLEQAVKPIFKLNISPKIIGTGIIVQSLSKLNMKLQSLLISLKNYREANIDKVKIMLQNKGNQVIFIRLQCSQGGQMLFSSEVLILESNFEYLEVPLSKNSTNSDLNFNLSNPITNQFYSFSKPSLVSDIQWNSYNLIGTTFQKTTSLPFYAIIGISVGSFCFVLVCFGGGFYYRRRKKQKQSLKLNLQNIKTNPENKNPSKISSRQLIQNQNLQGQISFKKLGSYSTLQTNFHSSSEKTQNPNSQYINNQIQNKDDLPSLQDKLQIKQQLNIEQLPSTHFKKGHRRTSSTVRILPKIEESTDQVASYSKQKDNPQQKKKPQRKTQKKIVFG